MPTCRAIMFVELELKCASLSNEWYIMVLVVFESATYLSLPLTRSGNTYVRAAYFPRNIDPSIIPWDFPSSLKFLFLCFFQSVSTTWPSDW